MKRTLNLDTDFILNTTAQSSADESYSHVKTFTNKEDNQIYYVKDAKDLPTAFRQILASKLKNHFLGDNSSKDVLVADGTYLEEWGKRKGEILNKVKIASREIKNLKTLNQVGHSCDDKTITGIDEVMAVNLLITDHNNEFKNFAFSVKPNLCVAFKIDLDEAYFNSENFDHDFFSRTKWNAQFYYSTYSLKFNINKENDEIVLNQIGNNREYRIDLDTLSTELQTKFHTQINNGESDITLSSFDLINLEIASHSYIPFTPLQPFEHRAPLLHKMKEIADTDEHTLRLIVKEAIEEVKLYYDQSDLLNEYWTSLKLKGEKIGSFGKLENLYVERLKTIQIEMSKQINKVLENNPQTLEEFEALEATFKTKKDDDIQKQEPAIISDPQNDGLAQQQGQPNDLERCYEDDLSASVRKQILSLDRYVQESALKAFDLLKNTPQVIHAPKITGKYKLELLELYGSNSINNIVRLLPYVYTGHMPTMTAYEVLDDHNTNTLLELYEGIKNAPDTEAQINIRKAADILKGADEVLLALHYTKDTTKFHFKLLEVYGKDFAYDISQLNSDIAFQSTEILEQCENISFDTITQMATIIDKLPQWKNTDGILAILNLKTTICKDGYIEFDENGEILFLGEIVKSGDIAEFS